MIMSLSFIKPAKISSSEAHNTYYSSDTNVAGTYVPNMSDDDRQKWKAKVILRGDDPRVEIRKSVNWVQLVLIVRKDGSVKMSANGKLEFDGKTFKELQEAVDEARSLLVVT